MRIRPEYQVWIDIRKRHHLSHAQVQMARELGMNPKKLGKLDNDKQEPWKLPLPQFIQKLYAKRFGRTEPQVVMSMEQRAQAAERKREARRDAKAERRAAQIARTEEGSPERAGAIFP